MKYPVIFKTFSVLFSLQSDERWIVPIFGGTIILLLAFSAWRLCTEEKGQVALPQNDAAFADPMGSWRTSVAGQCVADNDNFLDFSLCFDVAVYMSSGGVCRIHGV